MAITIPVVAVTPCFRLLPALDATQTEVKQLRISMMDPDTIKRLIEQGIPGCQAHVQGDDGTHFEAAIISEDFAGKNRVQQHQMVYRALGEKMGTDIHALSIRTYTPEQWEHARELRTLS